MFGNLNNFAKVPDNPSGFDDVFVIARTDELDGSELKNYIISMVDRYTIYTTTEYARREGREEGRVEGREEERTAMAQKLQAEGIEKAVIARVTSLSPEQVEELSHHQTQG